jgi:hypothetical protein
MSHRRQNLVHLIDRGFEGGDMVRADSGGFTRFCGGIVLRVCELCAKYKEFVLDGTELFFVLLCNALTDQKAQIGI